MLDRRHPQLAGAGRKQADDWGVDINEVAKVKAFFRDLPTLKAYYAQLSAAVRGQVQHGVSFTRALDVALQETETRWMKPGRIKIGEEDEEGNTLLTHQRWNAHTRKWETERTESVSTGHQGLSAPQFTQHVLKHRKAFKDVGAPKPHGEYAHRIQWYCIYHHFVERGPWDLDDIRDLWKVLANQNLVQGNVVGVLVSLWDSVLDIRGTWSRGEHPDIDEPKKELLRADYEGAQHAVAVNLTGSLTWTGAGKSRMEGNLVDPSTVDLSQAIGNRRTKRLQPREKSKQGDQVKKGRID